MFSEVVEHHSRKYAYVSVRELDQSRERGNEHSKSDGGFVIKGHRGIGRDCVSLPFAER